MALDEKKVRYEIHLKNGKTLSAYSNNAELAPIPQKQATESGNYFCLPNFTINKDEVVYIKNEVI